MMERDVDMLPTSHHTRDTALHRQLRDRDRRIEMLLQEARHLRRELSIAEDRLADAEVRADNAEEELRRSTEIWW